MGLVKSAHDCSHGGIAVTIAESAIIGGLGVTVPASLTGRWDACLFGESQSRIVVSVESAKVDGFLELAECQDVPVCVVGTVGGDSLKFGDAVHVDLQDASQAWNTGFEVATSS